MSYAWDEQKRRANVKKHGIDFIDIPELFDGDIVILPDERFNYDSYIDGLEALLSRAANHPAERSAELKEAIS